MTARIKLRVPTHDGLPPVEADCDSVETAIEFMKACGRVFGAPQAATRLPWPSSVTFSLGEVGPHPSTIRYQANCGHVPLNYSAAALSASDDGSDGFIVYDPSTSQISNWNPVAKDTSFYGAIIECKAATVKAPKEELRRWTPKLADELLADLSRPAKTLVFVLRDAWPSPMTADEIVKAGGAGSSNALGPFFAALTRASYAKGCRRLLVVYDGGGGPERYSLHPEFVEALRQAPSASRPPVLSNGMRLEYGGQ